MPSDLGTVACFALERFVFPALTSRRDSLGNLGSTEVPVMERRSLLVTANGWVRRLSYFPTFGWWIVSCLRCHRYWTVADPNEVHACPCHTVAAA